MGRFTPADATFADTPMAAGLFVAGTCGRSKWDQETAFFGDGIDAAVAENQLFRRAVQATFEWHEFNAAHTFIRDEGHRYYPELAQFCQGMMVALFNQTLRE